VSDQQPVHLLEDADNGARFLIYSGERGASIELRYEGDGLWMTQGQIAALFGVNIPAISKHISNILSDGELDVEASVSKMEIVRMEGERQVTRQLDHCSLDMVISVGYRVSSAQATLFRRWATDKLVQFATKGFVIDKVRLKHPDMQDRIAELREIIRDIRSDEANVYRSSNGYARCVKIMIQSLTSGESSTGIPKRSWYLPSPQKRQLRSFTTALMPMK